jgi:hypothetical protein
LPGRGGVGVSGDIKMNIFRRGNSELDKSEDEDADIPEFIRRDVDVPRANDSEMVGNNLSSLLQRVSVNSVHEIDRLIGELRVLSERLQQDSERIQREVVEYASLSTAAMQSTKIIAESLTHWRKDAPSGE